MKKSLYIGIALFSLTLVSCEKCKTCKHVLTPTSQETICEGNLTTEEYNNLIQQKEDLGYVCN